MHSLHARIFGSIALICTVALIGVGTYSTRVTSLQVEQLLPEHPAQPRTVQFRSAIESYRRSRGSFASVQPLLQDLAQRSNIRIILLTPNMRIIATSFASGTSVAAQAVANDTLRITVHRAANSEEILLRGGLPIHSPNGQTVARLFVFASPSALQHTVSLARTANRALWTAVAVALIAALIVAILLSRYIVGPVRELTAAATAMAAGDLKRRVRVRGDGELASLASSFNTMADAVEHTEDLRRRMVTDVAHELRSPLTRMRAQLEATEDGHLSMADALPSIYAETLGLQRLVDDLRDLSLADAKTLHLEKSAVSLPACIDEALAAIAPDASARGIRLITDVAPNVREVYADRMRIRQILTNLLENALKHAPPSGHIVVGAAQDERFAEFFVQDDGPGIDPAHSDVIFERFVRLDDSRTRKTGGSGVGLAIAKELTEMHGGTIAVETVPGAGARFTCRFPRP